MKTAERLFTTISGVPVEPVYTAEHLKGLSGDTAPPGEFPYTRINDQGTNFDRDRSFVVSAETRLPLGWSPFAERDSVGFGSGGGENRKQQKEQCDGCARESRVCRP